MRLALVLPIAICPALDAAADDRTHRPEGCERVLTAQFDNCTVSNTFRCQNEAAAFWIETIDGDNLMAVEARNADHGTLSVDYVGQGLSMQISQSKAHPRDTVRNGSGADTILGTMNFFGMSRPLSGTTSYGHVGETRDLAGQTFARIAFYGSAVFPPPMPEAKGDGTLLYSAKIDVLIEERVHYDLGGKIEANNLVHLALPGQSGFGEEVPRHGCGELSFLSDHRTEAAT